MRGGGRGGFGRILPIEKLTLPLASPLFEKRAEGKNGKALQPFTHSVVDQGSMALLTDSTSVHGSLKQQDGLEKDAMETSSWKRWNFYEGVARKIQCSTLAHASPDIKRISRMLIAYILGILSNKEQFAIFSLVEY
ncbi:hypothetical protein CEXT_425311 [Caerostris extrusa]|uniref:Uncharacterized protein n=1 Tax=Caerostris extrusa TaxID=172846 RepID=A0AAV4UXS5_CAEEX|nr:hypothetical protein CEXT_425311 [Caerostris extrusa]